MAIGYRKRDANKIRIVDSVDNAEIVLGLCEGEIQGLENGLQSFYFGDTPLQNSQGGDNFEDYDLDIYPGSGDNEKITYKLGGGTNPVSVRQELVSGEPKVAYGTLKNIDYLDIRIVVNYLLDTANSKGKIRDYNVQVLIEYQAASEGNTWHNINGTDEPFILVGQVTSKTVQQFRVEVSRINEPYNVRVTKVSPDADGTSYHNDIEFESFYELVKTAREFPYTAIAQIYIKSSGQLSSIPSVSGIYKLKRIRVPINYNPTTREYNGAWNGSFKMAWSDNPAWCLYDFVMDNRYGMNAYADVEMDKWDCYEAAQWCDELVSNGRGGQEPRFTCNLVQTDATNGREFVSYLAGLFNAFIVEPSTGYLRLFVDRDADAVFLFTPENVTDTGFSYSFTNPETRYNDIKVSFTNPDMNWTADTRRLLDYLDEESDTYKRIQDDISFNGRVTYDFVAVGCIREGEALRRAFYKLNMALNETMQVTFTTNRQAQCLSNFDIILIADPVLGYSLSGRIKSLSADRKTIYLRDSIRFETVDDEFTITFNTPEGIYVNKLAPLDTPGQKYELELEEVVPEGILPEAATFSISGNNQFGMAKPFRILSITETDGNPDQYTITAMELDRGKWTAADNLVLSKPTEYSGLLSPSDIPHIKDLTFYLTYNPVDLQTELKLTPVYVDSYPYYSGNIRVYTRLKGTTEWTRQDLINGDTVVDLPTGEYEFMVLPVSTTGITPSEETAPIFPYTVPSVNQRPDNVMNLQVERSTSGVQLSWDPVSNIDLAGYEIRKGEDWDTAEVVVTNLMSNSFYIALIDASTQHYMVCAKNYLGNYSEFPAFVATKVMAPDDVTTFYATVSLDRVRFDWSQVPGTDIEYEIRQGDNWSTGIKVASAKGNNTTILLPSLPNIVYCIKAKSLAGLYSKNARYTQPDMELKSDRNVIIKVDNGAAGFPGVTYGFEPYAIYNEDTSSMMTIPNVMVMSQEVLRAEHYFTVSLNKETRARNWFETSAFANPTRMRWVDLHYLWNQTESHISWLGSQSLDVEGEIEPVITKYIGADNYNKLIGFSYNETLEDISETYTPSSSSNVTYSGAHLVNGLVLGENTKVNYQNILLPEIFNVTFRLKVDSNSEDNLNLITFLNNQDYIRIYTSDGKVYCKCSDHNDLEIEYKHAASLDFLTFGFSQSETERSLYFFADYGNFESSETINATPIGAFNKYCINKEIGEPL